MKRTIVFSVFRSKKHLRKKRESKRQQQTPATPPALIRTLQPGEAAQGGRVAAERLCDAFPNSEHHDGVALAKAFGGGNTHPFDGAIPKEERQAEQAKYGEM